MPNKLVLVLLTILVAIFTALAIYFFRNDPTQLSAYGSIIAGAGSIIAVIWFTGSLWYQSQQIREQRTQFLSEFKQLREDGRRNALLLAREILKDAENQALASAGISSISELPTFYTRNIGEWKNIHESDDPQVVQAAILRWGKIDWAAVSLMRGLKSAAQVYFMAIGKDDVDYSNDAEEFVYIYGPQLWSFPFFDVYQGVGTLAEFMVMLEPGRKGIIIATFGAMFKQSGEKYLNMDRVREDFRKHLEKEYPLPKIAEELRNFLE